MVLKDSSNKSLVYYERKTTSQISLLRFHDYIRFFTLVIISFTSYSGSPQWLIVTSGVLGNLMMIPAVLAVVVLLGISLF